MTTTPGVGRTEYSDVEYVFEPHDSSMPPARQYLERVWDRRAFMVANARAELKGRNSGTILGEAWRVLDPLFQALIYWFLFTAIRGSSGSKQFLMVVSGVFLFNLSMTAMGQGGRSIQRSRGLVLNSTFPLATLPLSVIYRAVLELIPTMGVYAVLHLLFRGPVGSSIFMLPLLFILQLAISIGMMFFFATLTVYIRDMSNLLEYIMRILMFLTPVIYPASQLDKLPKLLHAILYLNPLFTLFSAYQACLTGGTPKASMIAWASQLTIAFA